MWVSVLKVNLFIFCHWQAPQGSAICINCTNGEARVSKYHARLSKLIFGAERVRYVCMRVCMSHADVGRELVTVYWVPNGRGRPSRRLCLAVGKVPVARGGRRVRPREQRQRPASPRPETSACSGLSPRPAAGALECHPSDASRGGGVWARRVSPAVWSRR